MIHRYIELVGRRERVFYNFVYPGVGELKGFLLMFHGISNAVQGHLILIGLVAQKRLGVGVKLSRAGWKVCYSCSIQTQCA